MGVALSVFQEAFPGKATFTADDIPDLSGKVMIVTGGNAGIGKEITKALLAHNAKVYIVARDEAKALKAIEELKSITGQEASFLHVDLADLASVKAGAVDFLSKEGKLDVLFNNGGVMVPPITQITAQGYDQQFGVNVLGHFFFTKLLLPTLLATPGARLVTTSSSGHLFAKGLDFNTFKDGPARKKLGVQGLYFQSKFGNVVVANEFARRYGDQGLISTSLNPGNIRSELQRHLSKLEEFFVSMILFPTPYGALNSLYAGTMPETGDASVNGAYFIPWAKQGTSLPQTHDEALGNELWTYLNEQVKPFE